MAVRHPGIIREILSRGHSTGNHSFSHMPPLMLKGMRTLRREIKAGQAVLGRFGIVPLARLIGKAVMQRGVTPGGRL